MPIFKLCLLLATGTFNVWAVYWSWKPDATSANTATAFITGTAYAIFATGLFARTAARDPRVLFALWLPPAVALLLASKLIAGMLEDRLFGWQEIALPSACVATVFVLVMLGYLVVKTGTSAASLARGERVTASSVLAYALQSYFAITILLAALYAGVEAYTHGRAFAGMHPDWPGESAEIKKLGTDDPVWKEGADAYSEYTSSPYALQVDALYFSVITSATVGYGDITPRYPVMRAVVAAHVLVSQFILVVLIGIVFSRFSQPVGNG